MCGLAGFIGQKDFGTCRKISEAIAHRGPDSEGFHYEEDLGLHLIHRRLSILDISGGQQPMWDSQDKVCIVFNGEIYNFLDLRSDLESKGYQFQSNNSDTEVLIYGYMEWGTSLFRKLNGMFALCILDIINQTLVFARDRFGEKPLYIYQDKSQFAFASEPQALSMVPGIDFNVDRLSMAKYFSFGFLPDGSSIYENLHQLNPGHYLVLRWGQIKDPNTNWRNLARAYWNFSIQPDEISFSNRSDEDVSEEFWDLFKNSVDRRLLSDVPVGVFLSGGLDSSAVLLAAKEIDQTSLPSAFSIGFDDPSYDESVFAREVADYIGVNHHVSIFNQEQLIQSINTVLPRMGEPLADASILPTALLSSFTREHVTVALSGDGGDELLAGYDPFDALRFAQICHYFAMPFTVDLINFILSLIPKSDSYMALDFKISRALEGILEERRLWEAVWMSPIPPRYLEEAFGSCFQYDDLYGELYTVFENVKNCSNLEQALAYFTQLYLPNNILTKSDRASMLSSLETRAVFLDNDLVDFCSRLPTRYKYRNGTRKFILKLALRSRLPENIIERKKQGFGIPIAKWFRETNILSEANKTPYLSDNFVEQSKSEHIKGKRDHRLFLFAWLAANNSLSIKG